MKNFIPIPQFEQYKINSDGIIINKKGNKVKYQKQNSGYLIVHLYNNGKRKALTVHRIVAKLFVANPDNKDQVNHLDLDKLNIKSSNLVWSTAKENMYHLFKSGKMDKSIEKARIRMKKIGKKYSSVNSIRLKTSKRNKKGWII